MTKMTKAMLKKILELSLFFMMISTVVLLLPLKSFGTGEEGSQYVINIDVSPHIVNIESERGGEIRILTNMRYSLFAANGHSIFIYFNGSDSVENIRPTRDSLGNLVLKFNLEDLLTLQSWLKPKELNDVKVVVSMDNGDEYEGQDDVYITIKG